MQVVRVDPKHLFLLERAIGSDYIHVYASSDGEVWHSAGRQQQLEMNHLVVSSGATHSKVLYRLLEGGSVLGRSVDSGRTWAQAKLHFSGRDDEHKLQQTRISITILGTNGLTLYARASVRELSESRDRPRPGVYVSHDGGDDWQLFASDLLVGTTIAEYEGAILAVNATGLVESRDNGRTWSASEIAQRLPPSLPLRDAQDVPPDRRQKSLELYQAEFPQSDPHSVFLVTNGGLFITHDDGKSWCLTTFGSDVLYTVSSVAFANQSGSRVLATTVNPSGPLLWESKDGGRSFQRILIGE